MVEYGPIQLLVLAFPSLDKLKGELINEIFSLSEKGLIRVVGLQAVLKDKNGRITSAAVTELPEEERIKLGAAIGALIGLGAAGTEGVLPGAQAGAESVAEKVAQREFGLSQRQVKEIADELPNDTAAGFLLIEHIWAKKFKEIARAQDGVVLANGFIAPEAFVAIGALLAEGADAAQKIELK